MPSLGKLKAFSLGNMYSSISLCLSREALLFCFPTFIWRESSEKEQQFNRAEMGAMAMTSTQLHNSTLVSNLAQRSLVILIP
ncbi:hypothetical protein AMTRI_Chr08g160900 [Amborella trichopoda]